MSKIRTNTGFKGVTKRMSGTCIGKYEVNIRTSNGRYTKIHSKLKDAINDRMNQLENLIS